MMDREQHGSSTPDSKAATDLRFVLRVEGLYAALIGLAEDAEPGLGGKLLYAGELDDLGRALLVAGNIAGAASLAATADAAAQKQAIRDGVADFLVNSLDEALRILKNEVRKRETVAVCVAAAPEAVEREMRERGVVADLAPRDGPLVGRDELALLTWSVGSSPAQWLPKLDRIAVNCLGPGYGSGRRWLRLAPRYLGRMAQGARVLRCELGIAREIAAAVEKAVERGEISAPVQMTVSPYPEGSEESYAFQPRPVR